MPSSTVNKIGRFQIRSELGKGAFGRVYRAYDPTLDREVALKVPTIRASRGEHARRFLREAQSAAKLKHPNIVQVYEVGVADDTLYIASEYINGQSLVERCKLDWPSTKESIEWVIQIADALKYAHQEGIVHRDVKPANILIDRRGQARLTDFGLAKQEGDVEPDWLKKAAEDAGADVKLSKEGIVMGTPAYMAPEQARGRASLTGPHSDQYSLGVVLYELLAGRVPFQGRISQIIDSVGDPRQKAASPKQFNRRIPADLAAVALKAIRKNPEKRYPSMNDFAIDLQRWQHGLSVSVRRRSQYELAQRRTRYWMNSHPGFITFVATLVLFVSVAALTRGWLWDWITRK